MKKQRVSKGLYFFIPKRYEDSGKYTILFRALSQKELIAIEELIDERGEAEAQYRAFSLAVTSIEDSLGKPVDFYTLPYNVIKETAEKIFEVSGVTLEEYQQLQTSIEIYFDKKYQTDSWKCEICREKRLDRVRNCGFRGEKDKDPSFVTYVGSQPYSYCPIYDVNKELLSEAIECYNSYDAGFLPDSGGFYDQTRFFIISSQSIFQKLKEEEAKELEKLKKSNR